MATESVDDDKRELDIFEEYSHYFCEFTPERDNEQRCRWCGELEDEGRHTMKKAIETYYTRECARKVLEGRIDEIRYLAHYSQPRKGDPLQIEGIERDPEYVAGRLAELRAAIEEVGGGDD